MPNIDFRCGRCGVTSRRHHNARKCLHCRGDLTPVVEYAFDSMIDCQQLIRQMDQLRRDGWCVVLKCLPDGFPWIDGGDPSEYGGSVEPSAVSRQTWCCEAQDVDWRKEGIRHLRASQCAFAATPGEAVASVVKKTQTSQKAGGE